MVLIDIKRAFVGNDEKINLPTTEVLPLAAAGKLAKSKKLWDWMSRNAVLLMPFLTETELTNIETAAEALLKIFSKRINKQEAENTTEDSDVEEDSRFDEDNEKERAKTRSTKDATARDVMDGIATSCDNILAFLQVVYLKSPLLQAAPLLLRADKRAIRWFHQWADSNLKHQAPPQKSAPQDHFGLMGVLSEVEKSLHNAEAFRPAVTVKHEADRETRGWDRLSPTSHQVILAASTSDGLTIPSAPPPSIH